MRGVGWLWLLVPLVGGSVMARSVRQPTPISLGQATAAPGAFGGEAFVLTQAGEVRAVDGWGNQRTVATGLDPGATAVSVDPGGFLVWAVGAELRRRDLVTGREESWTAPQPIDTVALTCGGTAALLRGGGEVAIWPFGGAVRTLRVSEPLTTIDVASACGQLGIATKAGVGEVDLETGTVSLHRVIGDFEESRRSGDTLVTLRGDTILLFGATDVPVREWTVAGATHLAGWTGPSQPTVLTDDGKLWALP